MVITKRMVNDAVETELQLCQSLPGGQRRDRSKKVRKVARAFLQAVEEGRDLTTRDAAVKSIIAILGPYVLNWLLQWVFSSLIERLWKRMQSADQELSTR